MPIYTLKDRIASYEALTDFRLMKGLPIIIVLNGRSFRKTTSLLNKPFANEFLELMCACMLKLAAEVDGTIFVYSFNDEIILVAKNDQALETQAWYDNRIQKIVSAAASIATYEFSKMAKANNYNILGDPIFTANTFTVLNTIEAMNVLIAKQQQAQHKALYNACYYELLKKHDPNTVKQSIDNKTAQEKADMLFEVCGIDYNDYNTSYRRGVACFRAPKVINTSSGEEIRNKLVIETSLPIFSKEPELLENIFKGGKDIIRDRS
jgi:tRNA(His) guanylyltransferase